MALFAASVDTPDLNRQFAQKLGLDYPLLSDPKRTVATAYGVVGEGQPFASRWTFYIGMDGKILDIDKQVTVTEHGHQVAQKLAELGIPRRKVRRGL